MEHLYHTEICCEDQIANEQAQRLGLNTEPRWEWFPIVINLEDVVAVRANRYDDTEDMVTLYTGLDCFTVKGNYIEVLERWKKAKDTQFFKGK